VTRDKVMQIYREINIDNNCICECVNDCTDSMYMILFDMINVFLYKHA